MARTSSPRTLAARSSDFGPCMAMGPMPGSNTWTSRSRPWARPLPPQHHVGIGERNPEAIVVEPEDDGIVDHAARFVDQRRIGAHARYQAARVAWRHQLDKVLGIRAPDLDLLLAGDIPNLHVSLEVAIVLFHPAEGRGKQHVIVDGIALDALRLDRDENGVRRVRRDIESSGSAMIRVLVPGWRSPSARPSGCTSTVKARRPGSVLRLAGSV